MDLNTQKTNNIYFILKTSSIHFTRNCYNGDVLILRTDFVKDLGVMLDSKLYFQHVNYISSQALKLLDSFFT
jgi:hypothetical protein